MKILVIVPDYPNENSIAYQFVHNRVKEYIKEFEVDVFCYNNKFSKEYTFENVNVYGGNETVLLNLLKQNNYDKFIFHFLNGKNARFILKYLKNKEVYIWFHGSDCISWKRRLPRINFSKNKLINPIFSLKVVAFILFNKVRMYHIKKINKKCLNNTFVFVSNWNKETTEHDLKTVLNKTVVIHNFIDTNVFKYEVKNPQDRLNVLSINNYANNIYAGDMTQDIILEFSKHEEFKYFNFYIHGDGKLFEEYTNKLKQFDNVYIKRGFINADEIVTLHNKSGIFLYPKRGDSQGVSRCEAMASGLVPIASNVEAVSEFSPANTSYLTKDINDFVKALIYVYNNPDDFLEKSKVGCDYISKKCGYDNTIKKEIELLRVLK